MKEHKNIDQLLEDLDQVLEINDQSSQIDLKELSKKYDSNISKDAYKLVGKYEPFYLAYQNLNNIEYLKGSLENYGFPTQRVLEYLGSIEGGDKIFNELLSKNLITNLGWTNLDRNTTSPHFCSIIQ